MKEKYNIHDWRIILLTGLMGIPIGMLAGAVDTIFGRALLWIGDFRSAHVVWLVPFLAMAGIGTVWYCTRFAGKSAKGMTPIFIGAEVFGAAYAPYFFVVSAAAYAVNGNRCIYTKQRYVP